MSASMLRSVSRRAVQSVQLQQKRTFLDKKNDIIEKQRIMQKGSTPYLRGEADPTYLRLSNDKYHWYAITGLVAFGWVFTLYNHGRMWVGAKN